MAVSPLKRARAANSGTHSVSCLVDGCQSDLSNCRDYHRRHKVCELHSKTPQVLINGQKQRFCQQCSRFHSLEEFDEVKRSCRKRLDGHNRRRRKPQPEPVLHSGNFLSNYDQGAKLLPISGSQIYPSTTISAASWGGVIKTEEDAKLYSHHQNLNFQNPFPGSSSGSSYREGKLSFLLGNQTTPQASTCHPFLNAVPSSASGGPLNCKPFSKSSTLFPDSDCALSLLSSPPTQNPAINLRHIVQPDPIPMAEPLVPNPHYNSLGPVDSILVPSRGDANVEYQGMFHLQPDGSTRNEAPQTLPFYWE